MAAHINLIMKIPREGVERDLLGEGNLKEWYEALIKEMAGRTDG